jgi:hypothetical protein
MGTGGPFPWDKPRKEREPSSAEVMNELELRVYFLSPQAPTCRVVGLLYYTFTFELL